MVRDDGRPGTHDGDDGQDIAPRTLFLAQRRVVSAKTPGAFRRH